MPYMRLMPGGNLVAVWEECYVHHLYHSLSTVCLASMGQCRGLLLSGVQVVFPCPAAVLVFFQRVWVLRLAGVVSCSLASTWQGASVCELCEFLCEDDRAWVYPCVASGGSLLCAQRQAWSCHLVCGTTRACRFQDPLSQSAGTWRHSHDFWLQSLGVYVL